MSRNCATKWGVLIGKESLRFLKRTSISVSLTILRGHIFFVKRFPFGNEVSSKFMEELWDVKSLIDTPNGKLLFQTPTLLNVYRAKTLMTKEPETILWLDEIPAKSYFWDIGANIGIYSIYAAVLRNCKVVSVEPSYLNLDLLFRNVQNNNCEDKITILPLAVGANNREDFLFMSRENLIWGGAHNSAGLAINQSGESMLNPVRSLQVIATIDQLIKCYDLPEPEFIKIDVDGLELAVLEGALASFGNLISILIEIDVRNRENSDLIEKLLERNGFIKRGQIGNIMLSENQIWDKYE